MCFFIFYLWKKWCKQTHSLIVAWCHYRSYSSLYSEIVHRSRVVLRRSKLYHESSLYVIACVDLLHENWIQFRWKCKVNGHERILHITECLWAGIYCKPTFICMREIFARALSSRIYLTMNQSLAYDCNNKTYVD